jgi:hypothetical protein
LPISTSSTVSIPARRKASSTAIEPSLVAGTSTYAPPKVPTGVRTALAGCGALDAVERRIASLAGQARATLEAAADLPDDARAALLQMAALATRWGR